MKRVYCLFLITGMYVSGAIGLAQILPGYVPANGLQGWWPFNNNANDESGAGHNGTPLNGVAITTDRFGQQNSAYSFDGIDDRIFINYNFFDAGWNQYTISGWALLNVISNTNNNNSNHIFLNTSPHQGIGYGMNWGGSGKYYCFLGSGTNWNALFNAQSTQSLVTSAWKFMTLTKNGNTFKFYIDGNLDATWTSSVTIQSYLYKLYFGGTDPLTANEIIDGKLDDIGIWNRELTTQEITDLYNSNAVGINEHNSNPDISFFPNPVQDILLVRIKDAIERTYVITDALGQIVKAGELKAIENEINTNTLSSGVYVIQCSSKNGSVSRKFIKQ